MSCQFKLAVDSTYSCKHPVMHDHLCVFHLPKPTKLERKGMNNSEIGENNRIEAVFHQRFDAMLIAEIAAPSQAIDLRGFIFPKVTFTTDFSKDVNFTGAVFSSEVIFKGVEFGENATFDFAQFGGYSDFATTSFRKRASFSNASFGKVDSTQTVTFLSANFYNGATFSGSTFNHLAQFSGTTFGLGGPAMFYKVNFAADAVFHDAVFKEQTIFEATFIRRAGFVRSKFLSEAKFKQSVFADSADFRQASFYLADFSNVTFEGDSVFPESEFDRRAIFVHSEFKKSTHFEDSVFGEGANFDECRFRGQFTCTSTQYHGRADFLLAEFNQDADFRMCSFNKGGLFMATHFGSIVQFSNTIFENTVNFSNGHFGGAAEFINDSVSYGFNGECNFRDLNPDAHLTFRKVNLGKARFINTDLSAATFSNIQWFRHRHKLMPWMSRPASLWDEFRSPRDLKPEDYEAIAENYRQLVLNYEEKRDYETAESFHIGEMEMRRKKKAAGIPWLPLRKLREWVNSYAVYRVSNYYGTSYGLALLILLMLLGLFSLAFLYVGFRTVDEPKRTIEYNILTDASHHTVTTKEWMYDAMAAASLTASIVTFQKDRFYEPLEGVARLVLFVAVIVLTAQAAMTLLAIRRRFKR